MKISIVTISYNQAAFLEQCIRSVIEQDYHDVEYIVVDPGSTDGSRNIIEKYRDKITKVIFEPDKGPADGLNKGFSYATGKIYGYINADDYFEPSALEYVGNYFHENPCIDVLCGAIKIVNKEGRARIRGRTSDYFNLKNYVAGMCMICQQATFFRKNGFIRSPGFNTENRTCWDAEIVVDMALSGCSFGNVNKVLGNFRIYEDSISGSGKLNERYLIDKKNILRKVESNNIKIYPKWKSIIKKIAYKFNLVRHYRYLSVR